MVYSFSSDPVKIQQLVREHHAKYLRGKKQKKVKQASLSM
jgi:hypothetical protein